MRALHGNGKNAGSTPGNISGDFRNLTKLLANEGKSWNKIKKAKWVNRHIEKQSQIDQLRRSPYSSADGRRQIADGRSRKGRPVGSRANGWKQRRIHPHSQRSPAIATRRQHTEGEVRVQPYDGADGSDDLSYLWSTKLIIIMPILFLGSNTRRCSSTPKVAPWGSGPTRSECCESILSCLLWGILHRTETKYTTRLFALVCPLYVLWAPHQPSASEQCKSLSI